MVKVNENKSDLHGHGPMSSMSSDGSFVILERSPPQEPTGQFPNHAGQQAMDLPPFPAHNSFSGSQVQLESQVSI